MQRRKRGKKENWRKTRTRKKVKTDKEARKLKKVKQKKEKTAQQTSPKSPKRPSLAKRCVHKCVCCHWEVTEQDLTSTEAEDEFMDAVGEWDRVCVATKVEHCRRILVEPVTFKNISLEDETLEAGTRICGLPKDHHSEEHHLPNFVLVHSRALILHPDQPDLNLDLHCSLSLSTVLLRLPSSSQFLLDPRYCGRSLRDSDVVYTINGDPDVADHSGIIKDVLTRYQEKRVLRVVVRRPQNVRMHLRPKHKEPYGIKAVIGSPAPGVDKGLECVVLQQQPIPDSALGRWLAKHAPLVNWEDKHKDFAVELNFRQAQILRLNGMSNIKAIMKRLEQSPPDPEHLGIHSLAPQMPPPVLSPATGALARYGPRQIPRLQPPPCLLQVNPKTFAGLVFLVGGVIGLVLLFEGSFIGRCQTCQPSSQGTPEGESQPETVCHSKKPGRIDCVFASHVLKVIIFFCSIVVGFLLMGWSRVDVVDEKNYREYEKDQPKKRKIAKLVFHCPVCCGWPWSKCCARRKKKQELAAQRSFAEPRRNPLKACMQRLCPKCVRNTCFMCFIEAKRTLGLEHGTEIELDSRYISGWDGQSGIVPGRRMTWGELKRVLKVKEARVVDKVNIDSVFTGIEHQTPILLEDEMGKTGMQIIEKSQHVPNLQHNSLKELQSGGMFISPSVVIEDVPHTSVTMMSMLKLFIDKNENKSRADKIFDDKNESKSRAIAIMLKDTSDTPEGRRAQRASINAMLGDEEKRATLIAMHEEAKKDKLAKEEMKGLPQEFQRFYDSLPKHAQHFVVEGMMDGDDGPSDAGSEEEDWDAPPESRFEPIAVDQAGCVVAYGEEAERLVAVGAAQDNDRSPVRLLLLDKAVPGCIFERKVDPNDPQDSEALFYCGQIYGYTANGTQKIDFTALPPHVDEKPLPVWVQAVQAASPPPQQHL